MKHTNHIKRIVITTGALLMLFSSPIIQNNPLGEYINLNMTSYAAEQSLTQSARWVGGGNIWRVSDNNGGYLKNCWFQDDITGHWYLLGAEDGTVMYAGLITDQSTQKTYLLNTNHDGTYGRMITTDGTYNLNGKSVYLTFNQAHDGTFGSITSGLSDAQSSGIESKDLNSIPTDSNTGNTESTNNSSSSNEQDQTGKVTDPSQLKDGQFAIIDGHMWIKYDGLLNDMGSTAGRNDVGDIELH